MAEQGESMGGERPQISGGQERAEREFRPTWLITEKEPFIKLENENEKLARRIRKLNEYALDESEFTLEELRSERARLEHQSEDGIFGDRGEEQARPYVENMRKEIKRRSEVGGPQVRSVVPETEAISEAFRSGLSKAFQESRLPEDQQYIEFQRTERWANSKYEINKDQPPVYWIKLSKEERMRIELRAELLRAVNEKRERGITLEDLAGNAELAGITKSETAALYNIPGVRRAMEEYVFLAEDPKTQLLVREEKISLFGCKDRTDVEAFRHRVENVVAEHLREPAPEYAQDQEEARGWGLQEIRKRAVDAEQVALNLLYIGNFFESMDSRWEDLGGGKYRSLGRPSLRAAELLTLPIKGDLNPLDKAIESYKKEPGEASKVGSFGSWAHNMTRAAISAIGASEVGEVVVLPYSRENTTKWWTAEPYNENGTRKARIFVPDFYPVKPVGSIWEVISINKKQLISYMREGERIPWEQPEAANLWVEYLLKIRAYSEIWKFFEAEDPDRIVGPAKWSGYEAARGATAQWSEVVLKNLRVLKWATDEDLKRWVLYAAMGIKPKLRLPTTKLREADRWIVKRIIGDYTNSNKVFFPWDNPGPLASFK